MLGLFVPATGPQYTAGMQLEGTIQALPVTGTDRCLARHGVTIPVPPMASMAARYADNYVDNSQFPGPGPDLAHPRLRAEHVPVSSSSRRPGSARHSTGGFGPCQHAATAAVRAAAVGRPAAERPRLEHPHDPRPDRPPGAGHAGRPARVRDRYGWPSNPYGPPATAIRSFTDFADWVFGHLDGAGSRGASAAAMRRLDQHWSVVFVRCGRPTLAAQDRWLAAGQTGFVRQHRRQVRAVEALARRVLREARKPGRLTRLDPPAWSYSRLTCSRDSAPPPGRRPQCQA